MKEWLMFFIGTTVIQLPIIFYLIGKVNNPEINIRKQVQRNRNSPDNVQEYNATQNTEKGILKKLKRKRNEKQ